MTEGGKEPSDGGTDETAHAAECDSADEEDDENSGKMRMTLDLTEEA